MLDEVGKWYDGVLGKKPSKKRTRKNPAKFERCVREVEASAKKHGYPLKSAYAVCNAAIRKNPASNGGRVDGVDYTKWFKTHSSDDCYTLDLGRDGWLNIPVGHKREAMRVAKQIAMGTGEVFNAEGVRVIGPTRVRVFGRVGGRERILFAEFAASKPSKRKNPHR